MSSNPASTGTGLINRLATVHQGRASAWRFALLALWIIWGLLLFGGLLLGQSHDADQHRMPTWCRMASSLLLVVAGWTWFAATKGWRTERFALLLAVGMTLGFIGDLFNADLIPLGQANPVLGGIAAFALGHVAYIAGCVFAAKAAGVNSAKACWASLVVWWAIALVCWYFVAWQGAKSTELRWPALPYTLLLASTTGMATGLAIQDRRFGLLALGGVLFLISDLVLAFQLFQHPIYLGGDIVWLLYGPAQMLIIYSVAPARRAMERVDFALGPDVPRPA